MFFSLGFVLLLVGLGIAKIVGPSSVTVGLAEISIRKINKWDYLSAALIYIGALLMLASGLWLIAGFMP